MELEFRVARDCLAPLLWGMIPSGKDRSAGSRSIRLSQLPVCVYGASSDLGAGGLAGSNYLGRVRMPPTTLYTLNPNP